MLSQAIIEATESRYRDRATERSRTIRALRSTGGLLDANDAATVRRRTRRVIVAPSVNATTATELEEPKTRRHALERVVLGDDLMNINYLGLGMKAAHSVARIQVRDPAGSQIGWGSGFLISPDLLLTNHHVLPDAATAGASRVQVPGEDDIEGNPLPVQVFNLDPDLFFVTSPEKQLDYTIVAVALSADRTTLASYGFNRLIPATGKLVKGEYVSIIQFPNGGQKQIALRQNQVVDIFKDFIHYETDTAPGSSGAPVMNDQWEVVALHHSGVPETRNGKWVNIDGGIWKASEGEERVHWIANEGIRISAIVADLKSRPLKGDKLALRKAVIRGT
jgi:V8-like Glu-specific endopeptidase